MTNPAILVEDVTHFYASRPSPLEVLHNVNFSVKEDQFVAIVGPSGCGKSTLLNAIAGVISPTHGRVEIFGAAPMRSAEQGRLAVAFQDHTLLPWRTVNQNVSLPLELLNRATAYDTIPILINRMGLDGFGDRYPDELSGGMRSRVALARALVTSPSVLLLDEPFGALDEMTAYKITIELMIATANSRPAVVMVTHNIVQAALLADRIIVISKRPASIERKISVPEPYPRGSEFLNSERLSRIVRDIRHTLTIEGDIL